MLVPPRLSDPVGSEAGADQTPSTALSNPIVSGCHPSGRAPRSSEELLRFLRTSGSPFQVASAAFFSKRVLLTDQPYVVAGDEAFAAGSNVTASTYSELELCFARYIKGDAKEDTKRQSRRQKRGGKKNNINEHKTKRGPQA